MARFLSNELEMLKEVVCRNWENHKKPWDNQLPGPSKFH